ncbi:hypothetical protein ACJ41O_003226 [Fusarium nematophilum]
MKRCTITCASRFQVLRLGIEGWRGFGSYEKSALTKEALTRQVESGLGHDAEGNPLKIDADAKTVSTAAGTLPISPIMDPAWMKARRRQRKEMPSKVSGQFRKKLSNNPYAEALITPLRRCKNAEVILPRYFFQDFELVNHPDPNETSAWWAPGPLAFDSVMPFHDPNVPKSRSQQNANAEAEPAGEATEATTESTNGVVTEATISPTALDATQETPAKRIRPRRAPITAYMLARKTVLDITGGRGDRPLAKLTAFRHGMASPNKKKVARVWRADMGDVVLQMMRSKAVEALIHRGNRSESPKFKFIRPCVDWDEAKKAETGGCVLWLPKESTGTTASYATLDVEGSNYGAKMAVHDLKWLLGEEEVQRLRDGAGLFRDQELLVLRHWKSQSARSLHLLLWRLQGYLAEPKFVDRRNIEAI